MSLAYDSERRYVNLDGEPVHEDTLPEDMSDADYGEWFARSFVPGGVGCRVGPPVQRVVPKEQLEAVLAHVNRLESRIRQQSEQISRLQETVQRFQERSQEAPSHPPVTVRGEPMACPCGKCGEGYFGER